MMIHRKFKTHLLLAAGAILLTAAGATASNSKQNDQIPSKIENKVHHLMNNLRNRGFEVSRGYFKLWETKDCDYTYERIGFCGNNPAAPYVAVALPPWKEEFVDPALADIWGSSKEGYNDVYRLDPHEAIVVIGQLPPHGSYFSQQTWVFTREGNFDENSSRYQDIVNSPLGNLANIFFKKANEKRIMAFSSLSNPNNNVVIDRQSGGSFGETKYFIITPDKYMEKSVRKMLAKIAVDRKDVFTEPIPSDMKVGLSEGSDDFTTLIRYAHPDDGGAPGTPSHSWRKNPPLAVLRIREKRSTHNPKLYPPVVLEERTAVDERPLNSDLRSLLSAVGRRWGQPCTTADCSDRSEPFIDLQGPPIYMVGNLCIPFMQNCVGDNWDASYHIHPPSPIDSGEIYVAAGVLGTKSGNAVYVSLGVNQIPMIKAVLNVSDQQLDGTAKEYSAEVNNTDKFYLWYFTRNCKGIEHLTYGHCSELTMIPEGFRTAIVQRNYIKPGTQRGPDSNLLLKPMMMKLNRL